LTISDFLNLKGAPQLAMRPKYCGTISANEVEIEASPEDIRAVLEKLCTLRAITVDGNDIMG